MERRKSKKTQRSLNRYQAAAPPSSSPSDFTARATQIAVSQICKFVGFKSAQLSALDCLTHVATLYLQALAKAAASYSNAANRTQSNVFDFINALHDVSAILGGFTGGSMLHKTGSLASSSVVKELSGFVSYTDEIPFAKPMPRWKSSPIARSSSGFEPRGLYLHIPTWLPEFPDEKTYKKEEKEEVAVKRGEDLVLWEESESVVKCWVGNEENGGGGGVGSGNLGRERARVRFTIGKVGSKKVGGGGGGGLVNVRKWVCKGGKRVCWNESGGVVVDEEKKNQTGTKKRKR